MSLSPLKFLKFSQLTLPSVQRIIPFNVVRREQRISQIAKHICLPFALPTQYNRSISYNLQAFFGRIGFLRHYCSAATAFPTTRDFKRSIQIKRAFDSISSWSHEKQRSNIIALLAKEFAFEVENSENITEKTVKDILRAVAKESVVFNSEDLESLNLMKSRKWLKGGWNDALTILLNEFVDKKIIWLGDKRKKELPLKIEQSVWRKSAIPFYFPGDKEEDKERGLEISVKKTKEWILQNPNGRVVVIQEGIWDGNFLIQLYMQLLGEKIDTKLVATDINPVSLGLFLLKCKLLGIPSKDFLTYLNSLHQPINLHEIEKFFLPSSFTQVLNIYFRVILDLEETDALEVFEKKAEEMCFDDLLIVTLVEETPDSIDALKEAGLKKTKDGKFFNQYSNQKDRKLSTILALKQNCLSGLQSHLEKFWIYDHRTVDIFIEIGSKKSSLFKASVVAFQLRKSLNRVYNDSQQRR